MKPIFEWSSSFETGCKIVDDQHKGLIAIVNKLVAAIVEGEGSGQVACANLLKEFHVYAQVHFETEEQMMDASRYPGSAQHKEQHLVFKQKFLDIQNLLDDKRELPTIQTAYFLIDWVNHHILTEDKKLFSYLHLQKGSR